MFIAFAIVALAALLVVHSLGMRWLGERAATRIAADAAIVERIAKIETEQAAQHKRHVEVAKKVDAAIAARIRR
jgi:uncharacterized membrane protein YfbV (UPF0208 family)